MVLEKFKSGFHKVLRNPGWAELFLMLIGGGCSVFIAERYHPEYRLEIYPFLAVEAQAMAGQASAADEGTKEKTALGSNADGRKGRKKKNVIKIEEEESADRLNMAFVFAEGDTEPMDSVAGKVFSSLSQKDAGWMADIYRISSLPPAQVAARIGKNLRQNPGSWGKVRVSFYDGDGTPISGYSNAREILSLASVYAYYHGIEDEKTFSDYAQALWSSSHSYEILLSDFYYCDGSCLEETEEDEEDIGEAAYEEGSLGGEGFESSTGTEPLSGESSSEEGPYFEDGRRENPSPEGGNDNNSSSESNISEGQVAPENETEGESVETEGIVLAAVSMAEEETEETLEEETTKEEELVFWPEEETPETTGKRKREPETTRDFSELVEKYKTEDMSSLMATANPLEASKLYELQYQDLFGTSEASEEAGSDGGSETGTSESREETGSALTSEPEDGTAAESGETSRKTGSCQGHIDLTIRAYITGLKETKNLFARDSAGNNETDWTESWQGWVQECQDSAKAIEEQDWYDSYGLTVSTSMYIRNPLSASEIAYYMSMLPEDTSWQRKEIIRCALGSVGNIPYYWGGKPSQPGYEGNGFGTVVSADRRGRALRGLDCSGWVNWVYWTALGSRLPYASTSGFVSGGRTIERSGLQPGDLILKTGEDTSHVCMFLAWAGDGSMYLIHEVGNSTNNVTVGRYRFDWPYYRSLITD